MWEARRLTNLWAPRPVTGIALPLLYLRSNALHGSCLLMPYAETDSGNASLPLVDGGWPWHKDMVSPEELCWAPEQEGAGLHWRTYMRRIYQTDARLAMLKCIKWTRIRELLLYMLCVCPPIVSPILCNTVRLKLLMKALSWKLSGELVLIVVGLNVYTRIVLRKIYLTSDVTAVNLWLNWKPSFCNREHTEFAACDYACLVKEITQKHFSLTCPFSYMTQPI
jgi:hypothetical protein